MIKPQQILLLLLTLLVAACAAAQNQPSQQMDAAAESAKTADGLVTTSGVLVSNQQDLSVAGTRVLAYPLGALNFSGDPAYQSDPVAADGHFSMRMPSGEYYFIASGPRTYTYYGRNPVLIGEDGSSDIKISLVDKRLIKPGITPQFETGVYGVLTHQGQPVAGAIIAVYTDLASSLKGLGLGTAAPTASEGIFQLALPPGSYYLVARKRTSGGFMGPLQAGDYFGYFPGNPVQVREGQVELTSIPMIEVPEKVSRLAAKMFGDTSIKGRVVDADGQPVAGMRVLLYDNPMMLNRPLIVSQPTGPDGAYVISFPAGGVYWLAARKKLGGPPLPGEEYGRYQGTADGSVQIKTGESFKDIVLETEKIK